jgi:hypothetical protein
MIPTVESAMDRGRRIGAGTEQTYREGLFDETITARLRQFIRKKD